MDIPRKNRIENEKLDALLQEFISEDPEVNEDLNMKFLLQSLSSIILHKEDFGNEFDHCVYIEKLNDFKKLIPFITNKCKIGKFNDILFRINKHFDDDYNDIEFIEIDGNIVIKIYLLKYEFEYFDYYKGEFEDVNFDYNFNENILKITMGIKSLKWMQAHIDLVRKENEGN